MDKIIATVIVLVIVLGLIAFAILPQQEGIKQAGEKGTTEQQKVLQMMNDPNVITGSSVKSYQGQGVTVTGASSSVNLTQLVDTQLYRITKKTFNSKGDLSEITIDIVDMKKDITN